MRKHRNGLMGVAAMILCIATSAQSQTWDAANDFSTASNPNGAWQYGWSSTLGGTFQPFANTGVFDEFIVSWCSSSTFNPPCVGHNSSDSVVSDYLNALSWEPHQMFFHPGRYDERAIVRWVAPENATLSIACGFTGLDQGGCCYVGGCTTDVHLLLNNISLLDGEVIGYGEGSGPDWSLLTSVAAGDTIDFVVGYGSNGHFVDDCTSIVAQITVVPEPSTLVLLGIAACFAGCGRGRRWIGCKAR
jgi:hypothetical protein